MLANDFATPSQILSQIFAYRSGGIPRHISPTPEISINTDVAVPAS
jgi:hypothetical protein